MRIGGCRPLLVSTAFIAACATTAIRWETKLNSEGDATQTKDGVTILHKAITEVPSELAAIPDQDCIVAGRPLPRDPGAPALVLQQVTILNKTEHVIAVPLANTRVQLLDPSGESVNALKREDALKAFEAAVPCASKGKVRKALERLKFLPVPPIADEKGKLELMPHSDWTGYVAFVVPERKHRLTGQWKFSFIEFPTATDDLGKIIRTAAFDFPFSVSAFLDTYKSGKIIKSQPAPVEFDAND